MNYFDNRIKQRAAKEQTPVPPSFSARLHETCTQLKKSEKHPSRSISSIWKLCAAAVFIFVALPNISVSAANAMEQIPVLGSLVQVVTLRNYQYDDGQSSASVSIPEIQDPDQAGIQLNQSIEQDISALIAQFEADVQVLTNGGHQLLDVSYDVVTNTEEWFTLRVNALEIRGSGHEMVRYYHINRATQEVATLSTLFASDQDYVSALSQEVRRQMEAQQGDPFFLNHFSGIAPEQNFYWNEDGNLVLVFDEGTIAAASEGIVEFVIPDEILSSLQ